jgi:hypothetical protein
MVLNPGGWPVPRPAYAVPMAVFVAMSMSDPVTSLYSSSESSSSDSTTIFEPSRDRTWHPLHEEERALPATPVTCCSGVVFPNSFSQIWPPVPFEVMVDFQ